MRRLSRCIVCRSNLLTRSLISIDISIDQKDDCDGGFVQKVIGVKGRDLLRLCTLPMTAEFIPQCGDGTLKRRFHRTQMRLHERRSNCIVAKNIKLCPVNFF